MSFLSGQLVHRGWITTRDVPNLIIGMGTCTRLAATRHLPRPPRAAKPGACVKLDVQEYAKSTWHPSLITGCGKLNSRSEASGLLSLSHAKIGAHDRLRAGYQQGTDPSNASADSTWQYYTVAR